MTAALIGKLPGEIGALVAHPDLLAPDEKMIALCRRWDLFCHDLFHADQERTLPEVQR
jgi:hypothetical protein